MNPITTPAKITLEFPWGERIEGEGVLSIRRRDRNDDDGDRCGPKPSPLVYPQSWLEITDGHIPLTPFTKWTYASAEQQVNSKAHFDEIEATALRLQAKAAELLALLPKSKIP